MTKSRYLVGALALSLAAAAWVGFARKAPADAAPPAEQRAFTIVAPGRVEPVRDAVRLAFEAQGRIAAILVDEGDPVHAGDVLARLDDRLASARVAAAKAAVEQAVARHALA